MMPSNWHQRSHKFVPAESDNTHLGIRHPKFGEGAGTTSEFTVEIDLLRLACSQAERSVFRILWEKTVLSDNDLTKGGSRPSYPCSILRFSRTPQYPYYHSPTFTALYLKPVFETQKCCQTYQLLIPLLSWYQPYIPLACSSHLHSIQLLYRWQDITFLLKVTSSYLNLYPRYLGNGENCVVINPTKYTAP